MKLVVAVSGGVDSVVLLDRLVKQGHHELIVAHFDHGIRSDSHKDAEFVEHLAQHYVVPFETKRESLGADASEDAARKHRYAFLRQVADRHDATLTTAHHMNDIAETVAINLIRGTGWRGLAVLDSPDIYRPLLVHTKQEIMSYAAKRSLSWREDASNASDQYLRNRIRMTDIDDETVRRIAQLRREQVALKRAMAVELETLSLTPPYERYFFIMLDRVVAIEVMRYVTSSQLTRPQMDRALTMIATAAPGAEYQAGNGVTLRFTSRQFTVQMVK